MAVEHFADKAAAIAFAADHWAQSAVEAIEKRDRFCVALSGGSTPAAIYKLLVKDSRVDWSRIWLFWSDERAVPPDHEQSNYRMAMSAGFPVPPEQIYRMEAEEDLEVHAALYQHHLERCCDGVLDLVMLGMGDDGHTASLFPGTEALKEEKKLVVANQVPDKGWRMTMTFPCINAARQRALYVLGEAKRERLQAVFKGEGKYPVERVHNPLWITDQEIKATDGHR